MLSIAANMDLKVQQLDIKTTFLRGDLEEEIYMQQLEGFVEKGKPGMPMEKEPVWAEVGTSAMVPKIQILHGGS